MASRTLTPFQSQEGSCATRRPVSGERGFASAAGLAFRTSTNTVETHARRQLPLLIAHRGGTADYPENTLLAIEQSLKAGADGVWMSVQATQDGVPVLYRPKDLRELTNGSGAVAEKTFEELSGLNAGYHFKSADGTHSYRQADKAVGIPAVEEALKLIPEGKQIYLDLKQTPAKHVVEAVSKLLDRHGAWDKVRLYSTDEDTVRLLRNDPRAQVAESRDRTRQRLAEHALEGGACKSVPAKPWVGFELKRKMILTEMFTLGQGDSPVYAQLWTQSAVDCFRKGRPDLPIVMFGVNTQSDLETATGLGAHAVLIDSPRKLIPQLGGTSPALANNQLPGYALTFAGYDQARTARAASSKSVSACEIRQQAGRRTRWVRGEIE
ncbi:glycerophosphodiester phosphodiesterase family protein [Phytohabitans flavus]|uniref:glycerophosphodiester phosphodiesterase family protein n=1 Tax=Phytohabitans flavus TaxID=1076124 RepID=UPI003639DF04